MRPVHRIGKSGDYYGPSRQFAATERQVAEYKKVVARHAGDLATFPAFTSRQKALKLVMKSDQLIAMVLRDSLAVTRASCFTRPNDPMQDIAIEQFDYFLDAIAKNQNL
jgi:hypothetical protein